MIDTSVLLLCIVVLFLYSPTRKELFLPVYNYLTGANDRLYRLLSTLKDLFEKHGVSYSITGVILLSSVEREKLRRGQSVATVLIRQSDVAKLLDMNGELLNLGLGLSDLPDGGYRLSGAVTLPLLSDTAIQIYPVTRAGDRWITDSRLLGYDEWYGENELFPTKMYKLGNLDLPGPRDPFPYLKRNFWSIGIGTSERVGVPRKRWWNISPRVYARRFPVVSRIDSVNGIMLDPRPIPGKRTILMGNGRLLMVPQVGIPRRKGRWTRFLWA